ncbi:MAG: cobalamin biosynthesis protein CbiM [Phycisphaerales bacterium]|nr:cobalamin biosynthesis protein CbiM [Phycisphaerales bacterium]
MLAMHMGNELLSPAVAVVCLLLAGMVLMFASWRAKRQIDPMKVPLMGVLGAFVFAAQMINFPILPGASGHLGGGVLLAVLLGPHAATLVMASILIIQCLIFQDGGLLSLGANIINLGVIPCYLGYALFRALAGPIPTMRRLYVAIFVASLFGMVAGAALVPVQVWFSGILTIPFSKFLALMVGLHILVALGEAFITFAVIVFVSRVRPQAFDLPIADAVYRQGVLSYRAIAASLLVVALLLGGVVSLTASTAPDALESRTTIAENPDNSVVRENTSPMMEKVTRLQEQTAPLPDYSWDSLGQWLGTSTSGIIGTLLTLLAVWQIGRFLRLKRRSI